MGLGSEIQVRIYSLEVRITSLSSISLDLEGLCLQMRVRWKAGELRDAWEGY